jgi:Flp pilus assembly protein TadG
MLGKRRFSEWEKGQRGVTFLLVAMTMFVVLAMAALAIDVAVLYAVRSEAQRAADAAALAAARAFVITGYASDASGGSLQGVATTMALQQINAVLQENKIAGRPAQLAPGSPSYNLATQGNPQVTVTVQQTGLPTFFSRIWSRAANTVSATATAEAYNPSGNSAAPPTSAQCVKPFIVPNQDPVLGGTFVDVNTGAITNPGAGGVVGEGPITFVGDCPLPPANTAPPGSCPNNDNPPIKNPPGTPPPSLELMAAALPAGTRSCPSCSGTGATAFENDIGCCNTTAMACNSGTQTNLGGAAWSIDNNAVPKGPGQPLKNGLQCLIHQQPGSGQDVLNVGPPLQFVAGGNNPLVQPPGNKVNTGDAITTSDSVITMLIYDDLTPIPPSGLITVVGYMQLFVASEGGGVGTFTGTILNVAGCGNSAGSNPVYGGGTSTIPVRLIHP